ncbi:hypothetical protein ASPFODRAFT_388617 [Aspergillus luchuensis CBS 106.47]|uniref:Uncharacterized protein n=1 Tax=Aspergillus luchuensis (strain CBS 106.47) TaxID=1137211 RepID=A0A1M3T3K7_ASPLC|nr:hypothetical protein ASPFODRAFT_388617 [Aspergillus luchuensis CBS 106.47]
MGMGWDGNGWPPDARRRLNDRLPAITPGPRDWAGRRLIVRPRLQWNSLPNNNHLEQLAEVRGESVPGQRPGQIVALLFRLQKPTIRHIACISPIRERTARLICFDAASSGVVGSAQDSSVQTGVQLAILFPGAISVLLIYLAGSTGPSMALR